MQHSITLFFAFMIMILSVLLAWLEVGCLTYVWRPFAVRKSVTYVALYNFFFILITVASSNTHFMLFYFPLPIIPGIYIVGKIFLYFVIAKNPVRSIFLFPIITLPLFIMISYAFLTTCSYINPTLDKMKKVMAAKQWWSLEMMMWLSIRNATDMRILVNEAIIMDSPESLKVLFRHGASAEEDYWINQAKSAATQWLVVKFLLDNSTVVFCHF